VTKARVVLVLQGLLAALAAAVLGLGLLIATEVVSLRPPSAAELAAACSQLALPDVSLVSASVLAFGSVAVAVVVLSVRSFVRQVWAARRFLAALHLTGPGPGESVLFAADTPHAFCTGLLRPRVYLADVTLEALRADELDAVLAHEAHHRRLRDPLRVAVARAVGDGLFFLPAARRLARRYGALAELAADAAAVRAAGAESLASALFIFERADPAVVGIAPERADHLLGDRLHWELPLALIAWSVAVLAAVAAVLWRLSDAAAHATINLPLLAAQSCMLVMALVPVVLGAGAVLGARRLVARGS
jgi:Zn-dependent protease with chaperone function